MRFIPDAAMPALPLLLYRLLSHARQQAALLMAPVLFIQPVPRHLRGYHRVAAATLLSRQQAATASHACQRH
jgi:hypothetical protein